MRKLESKKRGEHKKSEGRCIASGHMELCGIHLAAALVSWHHPQEVHASSVAM